MGTFFSGLVVGIVIGIIATAVVIEKLSRSFNPFK